MSARRRDASVRRAGGRTRAADGAERVIPLVASTDEVDFYGEVVDQETWRLARFLLNPTALYQHQRGCEPIGFYRDVRVENGPGRRELRMSLVLYPDDLAPPARLVWGRYCAGGPVPFSVGFSTPRTKEETRDGRKVRVLLDCELEEVSVVTIPANASAVAEARQKGLALYRHHRALTGQKKADTMDPFEKLMQEKGLTPETLAAKAGLTAEEYSAAMEGGGTEEQLAKIAAALELDPAALADLLGGEEETEVELSAEELAAKEAAAKAAKAKAAKGKGAKGKAAPPAEETDEDLAALLGARSPREAALKVKALLATRDEGAAPAARLKALETELAALRGASESREREAALAEYRAKGVLTPAREAGKVGKHLAGLKTAADVRAFLDVLEPVADAGGPAHEPAHEDGVLGERHLKELAAETGMKVEDLKAAAAELRTRPAVR